MLRQKYGRPSPFLRRRAVGIRPARSQSSFRSSTAASAVGDHPPRSRSRSRPGSGPVGGRLAVAGRRVCRKYRKASIRRLQQQEYDKLCRIVPALATRRHRRRISKVTVVEETIRYIDELHKALATKLQSKTGQRDVTVADAAETARRTFLEIESATTAHRSASSPHHCTPLSSSAAVAAGSAASRIGRDVDPCDRVPAVPSEQLPSR